MIDKDELRQICLAFSELVGEWITENDILLRPEAITFLRELGAYKAIVDTYENEVGLGKRFEVMCLNNNTMLFATEEDDNGKRDIGYYSV